jgi:hypothetical protein
MPQTIDCIPFVQATVFHERLKKIAASHPAFPEIYQRRDPRVEIAACPVTPHHSA